LKNSLTSKVVYSGLWSYGRIAFSGFFHVLVTAILARLLNPKDFGVVALASVILGILIVLGEEGFSQYVIYNNAPDSESRVNGAFWLNLCFAVIVSFIALMLLPVVNTFYRIKELPAILMLLILRFLIESFSYIPDALLKKRLDFAKIEFRNLIIDVFAGCLSLIMAFKGYGVWSLVFPLLILSPTRFIVSAITAKWLPKLNFFIHTWKEIFNYSKHLIGSTLTTLFLNEGDTLLMGKLLGVAQLGIYNIAFKSATMPIRTISTVTNKVAFPALTMLKGNKERMYENWVRMERLLGVFSFFLLSFLFIMADEFILSLYGQKWRSAIFPLRILIIFSIRQSVGNAGSAIFRTTGRTDLGFKLGIINLPFYFAGIYIGSFGGIVGVALGVTITRTLLGMLGFLFVGICLEKSFFEIVRPLWEPFLACSMAIIPLIVFKMSVMPFGGESSLIYLIKLGTGFFVAIVFYFFIIRTFFPVLGEEIWKVLEPILGNYESIIKKILNIDKGS